MEPDRVFAGIELGGTKCLCTLATGPGGIIAQESVHTTDPEATLGAIEAVLKRWWGEQPFAALGIASFGPVDLDPASDTFGYILTTTKSGWSMTDVGARLARPFPVPLGFDTDVNGAAFGERRWGAGLGLRDFAYVTVGTGVGVGLIVNGKATRGIGHSEIGHLRVPRLPGDTVPSTCPFHHDCVEGLAAGPAIERALGDEDFDNVGPDHPVWERVTTALTCLCHALIVTAGPWRIAIGGGVMVRQPHLLPRLDPMLRTSLGGYMRLPDAPIVVAPALADQAGPLGSIALAMSALTSMD